VTHSPDPNDSSSPSPCSREHTPIVPGTIGNASVIPSVVDTFSRAGHPVEIVLDHQAGEHVEGLYPQVAVTGSPWHVFARIDIQRL
jgi:hypothetical protein